MDRRYPPDYHPRPNLSSRLIGLAFALLVVAVVVFARNKIIESTPHFQMALSAATSSPEVQSELGTPLTPGLIHSTRSRPTHSAEYTVTLKGPRASATLSYAADHTGHEWTLAYCNVSLPGHPHPIALVPQH